LRWFTALGSTEKVTATFARECQGESAWTASKPIALLARTTGEGPAFPSVLFNAEGGLRRERCGGGAQRRMHRGVEHLRADVGLRSASSARHFSPLARPMGGAPAGISSLRWFLPSSSANGSARGGSRPFRLLPISTLRHQKPYGPG